MKKALLIIFVLAIGAVCGWWANEMSRFVERVEETTDRLSVQKVDSVFEIDSVVSDIEQFDVFFYRFMLEPEFQLSRVKFPFEYIYYVEGSGGDEMDTTYLAVEEWQHNPYYLERTTIPMLYDNFEMQLRDTGERVFLWSGVENGIFVTSVFKRIKGKWYLIKGEDFST